MNVYYLLKARSSQTDLVPPPSAADEEAPAPPDTEQCLDSHQGIRAARPFVISPRALKDRMEKARTRLSVSRTLALLPSEERRGGVAARSSVRWLNFDPHDERYLLVAMDCGAIQCFDTMQKMEQAVNNSRGPRPQPMPLGVVPTLTDYRRYWRQQARLVKPKFSVSRAHDGSVTAALWYPGDCGMFVSGGSDGTVKIWDAGEREEVFKFEFGSAVGALDFCHPRVFGGTSVLAGLRNGSVRFGDLRSGAAVASIRAHTQDVLALCGNPAVPWQLLSGSVDGSLKLWDVRSTRRWLVEFDQYKPAASVFGLFRRLSTNAAVTPSWRGTQAGGNGENDSRTETAAACDLERRAEQREAARRQEDKLWEFVIHGGDQQQDDYCARWTGTDGTRKTRMSSSAIASPAGRTIPPSSLAGRGLKRQRLQGSDRQGGLGGGNTLFASPPGGRERNVTAKGAQQGEKTATVPRAISAKVAHEGVGVKGVKISPCGRHVLSLGIDGRIKLWDAESGANSFVAFEVNGRGDGGRKGEQFASESRWRSIFYGAGEDVASADCWTGRCSSSVALQVDSSTRLRGKAVGCLWNERQRFLAVGTTTGEVQILAGGVVPSRKRHPRKLQGEVRNNGTLFLPYMIGRSHDDEEERWWELEKRAKYFAHDEWPSSDGTFGDEDESETTDSSENEEINSESDR